MSEFSDFLAERVGAAAPEESPAQAADRKRTEARVAQAERVQQWREFVAHFAGDGALDAARLKSLRQRAGLNEGELGQVLGLSADLIRSAEEGRSVGVLGKPLVQFCNAASDGGTERG